MGSEGDPPGAVRRLHPSSLLFSLGREAKRFLLPALAVLLLARSATADYWFAILFLPAAISALLRYATTTYRLAEGELVVRRGIAFRNERHIPYTKIQNIDLQQNPIHRLLGVAEVRIQTASGSEAEATLQVLSLDAVDAMRSKVFQGHPAMRQGDDAARRAEASSGQALAPPLPSAPPLRTLASIDAADLAVLGIVTHRGLVLVLAVFGFFWQYTRIGEDPEASSSALRRAVDALGGVASSPAALVVLGAALAAGLAVVMALSIGWAFLHFWGFRLQGAGDDLRTTFGLLTRVAATIPRHRIQHLSVLETPLHRLFRRVGIRVETAGSVARDEEHVLRMHWLVPLLRKEDLPTLLEEVQPPLRLDALEWQPIHPRAGLRLLRRGLGMAAVWTAVAVLLVGPPGVAVGILLAILAILRSRLEPPNMAWAATPEFIVYRSGWWTRSLSIARHGKLQVISLEQSPFDRRHRMATVGVDTAGAQLRGHRIRVRFLPEEAARSLHAVLGTAAARTEFRW